MDGDYFKDQYFALLNERLTTIEGKLDAIQSKMGYIYGFAAGIGLISSFAIDYIRTHFFGHT